MPPSQKASLATKAPQAGVLTIPMTVADCAAGWEKLYTEDGKPFWTNHNDKTTSWDPPLRMDNASTVPEVPGVVQKLRDESEMSIGGTATPVAVSVPQQTSMASTTTSKASHAGSAADPPLPPGVATCDNYKGLGRAAGLREWAGQLPGVRCGQYTAHQFLIGLPVGSD